MATLRVFYDDQVVGQLSDRAPSLEFEYDEGWLSSGIGFPISVSLPLRRGKRPGQFFSNLLPEGSARETITNRLRIAYDDDFALLTALGGECAGALTLLPPDQAPDAVDSRAQELPLRELELLARSGDYAAKENAERTRLSLAGAQDKLPVIVDRGRFYLPLGNTPSTHLLKFENPRFWQLPANEAFTTQLFRELGLRTVTASLCRFDAWDQRRSACCVTRYDRPRDGRRTTRLHQEDMCQALGYTNREKYEDHGGPNFTQVYDCLRRESKEPLVDGRALLDWWLLCWLCGNADGHAKNLSFLYHPQPNAVPGRPRLAPFYDLVCTRAYPGLDRRLATRIGNENDPGQIATKHLHGAASALRVGARFLTDRARTLALALPDAAERVRQRQEELHGQQGIYDNIVRAIRKQARRSARLLAG